MHSEGSEQEPRWQETPCQRVDFSTTPARLLLSEQSLASEQLKTLAKSCIEKGEAAPVLLVVEASAEPSHSMGVHEIPEGGAFSVGLPIESGLLTGKQLKRIAELSETHGSSTLCFTALPGVIFLKIHKEKVVPLLEGLEQIGLKMAPSVQSDPTPSS